MRKIQLAVVLCLILCLSACSGGVSQEKFDSVNNALELAEKETSELKEKVTLLEERLSDLQAEYDEYKSQMSEYEGLAQAEAEARKIEAEAIIQAEKEAKAAAEAKAKAEAEAKAKAGYETGITYDQLARRPDEYENELVKFRGKVVQVVEGETEINIRFAVNGNYNNIIFCGYFPEIVDSRVLENDNITIYGKSVGLYSYESTTGVPITIPGVWVEKIDQ